MNNIYFIENFLYTNLIIIVKGNGRCSFDVRVFLITYILYDVVCDIVTLFIKKNQHKICISKFSKN